MLDQLKRLVGGSGSTNSGVQADGIPPSGNRHQGRPHHGQSAQSRSGSLSRLTAYALHPHHQQQSARLRMQLVVPVAYAPPAVVAYGRNGRPVPVGYDPWYPVRYQQQQQQQHQPRTPVSRQLSARPDLASSTPSGSKKKLDKDHKDVYHHPTLHRDSVVPNGRSRLVPSRSLDSIHPHRIHPLKEKQPLSSQPPPLPVENKSSSKKMKDFFQRIKESVAGSNHHHPSNNRSGQGQRTDEWLLLRPSCEIGRAHV